MNIENLLQIEDNLAHILDNLKKRAETIHECENWWSVVRSENPSFDCPRIFKDEQLRRALQKALVYQMLMVSQVGFLSCREFLEPFKEHLQKLCQLSHQNYLVLMILVEERFSAQRQANSWVESLQTLLRKRQKKVLSKAERLSILLFNNEAIEKLFASLLAKVRSSIAQSEEAAEVCGHELFVQSQSILKNAALLSFDEAKDQVGHSLRENYASSIVSSENELRVGIDESLEQVAAPYIGEPPAKKYTLVLDLDETLVHFKELPEDEVHGGVLLVRPFAGEFLKAMSHFFELVIFTAGMQDYADWALE